MVSYCIENISESQTLAISSKARVMEKQGIDVVSFGAGEPDFDTPDNIKQAAIRAVNEGFTKYTDVAGVAELKEAICAKFKRDNNLNYKKENIVVSCGAKHSLYNAVHAVINPGNEVIIPVPYWVSYPEQVKLAGGKPVFVKDDFIDKVSRETRAVIINSPRNPDGKVYTKEELKLIADLAADNNLFVISDEIYEKIIYDAQHVSIASLNEDIKERTITVNGVSKSYAMTGWRIGYAAAPVEIAKAMTKLQGQVTGNPTSIAQAAAIEALKGPQDGVAEMSAEFRKRRDFIVKALNSINGFDCVLPEGAFYAFPKIPSEDSLSFAVDLLEKAHVAVVPGIAFGKEGYIRISYATSMENIIKGVKRIKEFVNTSH